MSRGQRKAALVDLVIELQHSHHYDAAAIAALLGVGARHVRSIIATYRAAPTPADQLPPLLSERIAQFRNGANCS